MTEQDQEKSDSYRLKGLIELCGFLEDDSFETVTISADDATRTWHVYVGKRHYWSGSIRRAIDEAIQGEK